MHRNSGEQGGLSLPYCAWLCIRFPNNKWFWGFMAQRIGNGMLNLFISTSYRFKSSLLVKSDQKFTSRQREPASTSNLSTTPCERWSPPGGRALECFLQVVWSGGGIVAGTTRERGWGVRVSLCAWWCLSPPRKDQLLWSLSSPVLRQDRR